MVRRNKIKIKSKIFKCIIHLKSFNSYIVSLSLTNETKDSKVIFIQSETCSYNVFRIWHGLGCHTYAN